MKVPTLPPLEGLPVWAQIVISLIVGVATLGVSFKGYFGNKSVPAVTTGHTASIAAASIVDVTAFHRLSESIVMLNTNVLALSNTVAESTHHNRNEIDLLREMCGRLRALVEEMERQGREQRENDRRDEARR
jgi:hypothetical protein